MFQFQLLESTVLSSHWFQMGQPAPPCHQANSAVFGVEDGRLQEVVELSLSMDVVCSVEELYDRSE